MDTFEFQTAAVRDLAWACFSPPLFITGELADDMQDVSNCGITLTPQRQQRLAALDKTPDALLAHLSPGSDYRLGIYFERLWHFFIDWDPQLELLGHNLAVRQGGRTLGEFDCLYYCHTRQRQFHLELAVKFYLGRVPEPGSHQGPSSWSRWLGPGCNDRLDWKVQHLLQHQIELSRRPEAAPVLAAAGVVNPAREVEIKGHLFGPATTTLPAPFAMHPQRHLHRWLHLHELDTWLDAQHPANAFLVLEKPHWLHPARATDADRPLSRAQLVANLQEHFRTARMPRLVACLDITGKELARLFVTGASWPFEGAATRTG